jgi:hypothetical protein
MLPAAIWSVIAERPVVTLGIVHRGKESSTTTVLQGHRPTVPAAQAKTLPLVAIAAKDEAGRSLGVRVVPRR